MTFRLTYATMFNPPEAMHERFEAAMHRVSAGLGTRHGVDGIRKTVPDRYRVPDWIRGDPFRYLLASSADAHLPKNRAHPTGA